MRFESTGISGAWMVELPRYSDDRGWFQEWFKFSRYTQEIGVEFRPVQANVSKSSAGTVRGIHYSIAPEGQGKLVTVMSGAIDDYIVDIRVGSPTFGQWRRVRLEESSARAVLIDPHLGHAFQALADDTVVSYMVTQEYNPTAEIGINPTCPDIAIYWSANLPLLVSEKDAHAPTLQQAKVTGTIPLFT